MGQRLYERFVSPGIGPDFLLCVDVAENEAQEEDHADHNELGGYEDVKEEKLERGHLEILEEEDDEAEDPDPYENELRIF